MTRLRIFLVFSLLSNVAFLSWFAFKWYRARSAEKVVFKRADNWQVWAKTRADVFRMLPRQKGGIVFLGTSITEAFPVTELFDGIEVKNRGVAGNELSHMESRLDEIIGLQPETLLVEAGINDIKHGENYDSLSGRYRRVIFLLKEKLSSTRIILQSVLPTNHTYSDLNSRIDKFNETIRNISKETKSEYFDLHGDFVRNEKLNDSLTYDGLHLNAKGYWLWKQRLNFFLNH